jgi:hypothetical protein
MITDQDGKEPVPTQRVPCWILFTLSHNIQPEGDINSGTATTSMKVNAFFFHSTTKKTYVIIFSKIRLLRRNNHSLVIYLIKLFVFPLLVFLIYLFIYSSN